MNAPNQQLSIFQTFAAERHMEKEALIQTLFKTIAPKDCTMEDLVGFLQIAHRFQLDPWAKEIFLIKSKGRISTYISVDGYTRIVNREPEYDGCEFDYEQDGDGHITAVTCRMYRKDRTRPTTVTEFYDECVPPPNDQGRISDAWARSPSRMLRHRAFVQAARLCFGVSGALDEPAESQVSAAVVDITPEPDRAPPPAAPKRKAPPAPGGTRNSSQASEDKGQSETARGQEQENSQSVSPAQQTDEAEFDVDGCMDALKAAKSLDELKQIYNDFEVDDHLQDKPEQLGLVQDTFVRMVKRLEREAERNS